MLHGERLQNLKFYNDPNSKQDKDSWAFAPPVYTRYPLMLQLGGLLPWLTRGPHLMAGWTGVFPPHTYTWFTSPVQGGFA